MKFFILLAAIILASITHAETAQINVAERDCSKTDLSKLFQFQTSRWTTESTSSSRANLDDSKCTGSDVQTWISTLSASCTTYFDVLSITPITKGYAQYSYHNYGYGDQGLNARAGAYGYSYTDRLIMTYRCL